MTMEAATITMPQQYLQDQPVKSVEDNVQPTDKEERAEKVAHSVNLRVEVEINSHQDRDDTNDDDLAPMNYSEEENVWVKVDETNNENIEIKSEPQTCVAENKSEASAKDDTLLIIEDTDHSPRDITEPTEVETELPEKLELRISESDLTKKGTLTNEIVEEITLVENVPQPELKETLELHISEADLVENGETANSLDNKEAKEIHSCQSSPGYIKPGTGRSTIAKQNSLDSQVLSDEEPEFKNSKRGSLHSPSSKIITKMTPITWDQWMKRPASYIPPQKTEPTTSTVDGKPEEKKPPVGESPPKVKKTRFLITPTSEILEPNREEPKILETFDETEEDQFLIENPNVLLESHLNELTMVETQLKKLGAAAKAGSKKFKEETDQERSMKRSSSADQRSKGWLAWLSVFTKKTPSSPQPPSKKQPARVKRPQQPRRLQPPPVLPEYPRITDEYYTIHQVCDTLHTHALVRSIHSSHLPIPLHSPHTLSCLFLDSFH